MATNDLYQSTFMPIFQKAETKIKELIWTAFLFNQPLMPLRSQIDGVIMWVASKIPPTLHDKNVYVRGLKKKSEIFILTYYVKPIRLFKNKRDALLSTKPTDKKVEIKTPSDLLTLTENKRDLWAEAKGLPNVTNYGNELKSYINKFSNDPITTSEPGKHPISLWQKAELDVRYEHQMEMLDNLRTEGVEYAWTSSHPNCSKRCEKWQGKLMDINNHAKGSNHIVTYLDGHPVYSLIDIMAKVDKYGYHNNIICGFNCRHKLIPYKKGKYGPEQYTQKDVAKERNIEEQIRVMERKIRQLKTKIMLLSSCGLKKECAILKKHVNILIDNYKKFCETNGYPWLQYRIDIM